MAVKQRYNVSVPEHVAAAVAKYAKALGATPTEYAGDIIRWWYGQGCPPVTHDEARLRVDVWRLDPSASYMLEGDSTVTALMRQLGVPNLFAAMIEHDEAKSFVAFDNHPTHWIILRIWKGHSKKSGNGLLFEAVPKVATSEPAMLSRLKSEAAEMESSGPVTFSQLPPRVVTASNPALSAR
jgi:hypothetical protein